MTNYALLLGFAYRDTKYQFDPTRIKNDLTLAYQKLRENLNTDKILIITDLTLPNTTKVTSSQQLMEVLYQFVTPLQSGDTLFIYFTGHGISKGPRTRLLINHKDQLPYHHWNGFLEDLPVRCRVLIILDCCDATGVVNIDDLPDQKIFVLAACAQGQLAGFHREQQVSLFTYHLFSLWGHLDLSILRGPVQREIDLLRQRYGKPRQVFQYLTNQVRYKDHLPSWLRK